MSTRPRIYLDYNATAPLVPAARDAMVEAMADVGNPSSVHAEGRRARDRIERARRQLAELVGRPREQIVFTSGGTEANWLGVRTLAAEAERRGLPRVIATTKLEHPSLRGAIAQLGWQIVDIADEVEVGVVAAALVNHEIGTILELPPRPHALVHVDAVQALGKMPLDMRADSIALSAHKVGGPQGIGALVTGVEMAGLEGGHQERGRRPGTENTLGIIGFGAAASVIDLATWKLVATRGERLEAGLRAIAGVRVHANGRRIGGTINVGVEGALGESIVIALDLAGIAVSTGAACTSGSIQPSPVLLGLGMTPAEAREAVRFSLGRGTSDDEIDEVIRILPVIVERARRHR